MNFRSLLFSLLLCLMSYLGMAHYLWIETPEIGKLNKSHQVKVYFGEYTYGAIEDPNSETFAGVKYFKLWVVSPSGQKEHIDVEAGENAFVGSFIPKEKGTYTVTMNNDEIPVIDYTQYDFGIFKTHYHATAKVVVGQQVLATQPTNSNGLALVNTTDQVARQNSEVSLQVYFKGEPFADQEVTIFVADLWSKKLESDETGTISFRLPWATTYTIETTYSEQVPGTYRGEDYEFVWHCATYAITL
ncbi:DUF4198 domain-containing protein [Marinoscillum furvescens]|uniref:Uncharacterized protein DUF4198 n=1 Tax=Marinoscillum furvescens DSM 4134 TaxID=1122208 RepID=A0A3D9L498_MARFU|nr:DUF4198 domain-containing protein [Marinoscillum furvescens]REE00445.1 uncharacterized protein DUF4198 [Marinoscillum furvescens DSM 4134]